MESRDGSGLPASWRERPPAYSVQDSDPAEWADHVERRLRVERRRDSVIAQEGIFVRRAPVARVELGLGCNDVVPTRSVEGT